MSTKETVLSPDTDFIAQQWGMVRVPYGEAPGGKTTETFDQKLTNAEHLLSLA